jgi:hypothetical protein
MINLYCRESPLGGLQIVVLFGLVSHAGLEGAAGNMAK